MNLAHRSLLCALVLSAVVMAGCKKETPTSQTNPSGGATQPVTDGTTAGPQSGRAANPAPILVQENADVNATLSQLTLELRKYVVRTRSVPKTFEEFVTKSQAQIPPPPPGKKYAIDGQAVVLKKS
jgi:hypothetical protein